MRHRRRTLALITAVAAMGGGVGLAAPTAGADPALEYVQLGDSYSAGNGAGTYDEKTCWRSPDNYGARVARADGASYTDVACSGGVVADILNPRPLGAPTTRTATYEIPGKAPNAAHHWLRQARAAELCGTPAQADWSYEYTVTSASQVGRARTATVSCQLTAAPQIDAVTRDTDAVFLTIGGNDIGFSSIVLSCLVLRSASSCEGSLETADARLPRLQQQTKQALDAVYERSGGHAQVYLLGYPHLINTDSYSIPEAAPTYDAGAALDALQLRGDRVQREAVAELDDTAEGPGGFTFVDVKPAWDGRTHGLDPRSVPDNSRAWLVPVLAPGREVPEWAHPTQDGYAASARALAAAMD